MKKLTPSQALLTRKRAAALPALLPTLLCTLLPLAAQAQAPSAPDLEAGRARAQTVCAACHGASGISVADNIPNLAGQKAAYLTAQLNALKAGTRKNALMNAMAAQLSSADIANVAAYFSSLPGATVAAAKSDLLPHLVKTSVNFPEGYQNSFTMYQTVNRSDNGQVRYLWANPVALKAAREGRDLPDGSVLVLEQHAAKVGDDKKPIVGPDGNFVKDRFLAYTIMERNAGWGKDIPEMLRNEDWNYAAFSTDKKLRTNVNQAECLACHKPLDKTSYTFSLEPLKAAAAKTR
jgi:cytochrome c553